MNYEEHRAQQQAFRDAKKKKREDAANKIAAHEAASKRAFYQKTYVIKKQELMAILKENSLMDDDVTEIFTIYSGTEDIFIEALRYESDYF